MPPDTEPVESPIYAVADSLLLNGTDPEQIIATITNPDLDDAKFYLFDAVNLRQYGCVDLKGRSAGYTGKDLENLYVDIGFNFSEVGYHHVQQDIQGRYGKNIVYSAQGNIVSNSTVSTLSETFTHVEACDLSERLFLSLEAVFEAEGDYVGDIRCFDTNGASGSSVFIHVDNSDGTEVIHIENSDPDPAENPWPMFKAVYEQWRQENPCETISGALSRIPQKGYHTFIPWSFLLVTFILF